jgi:hypothetical protein
LQLSENVLSENWARWTPGVWGYRFDTNGTEQGPVWKLVVPLLSFSRDVDIILSTVTVNFLFRKNELISFIMVAEDAINWSYA